MKMNEDTRSTFGLTVDLPAEVVDHIAQRVIDLQAERQKSIRANTSDGWLRGAKAIAAYVGCSRSRVYQLASARRIPLERDGSALIARRSDLDRWLASGGGRCP
jgi:excisionase family DNA binding protein